MGRPTVKARALGLVVLFCLAPGVVSAEERYRVELLVFRHTDTDPPPAEVITLRAFRNAWEPGQEAPPPHPVPSAEPGDTFQGAWRQLSRVAGYEPLLRLAWEQTRVDYHPPVRVHDEEVIAEELFFPYDRAWADLEAGDPLGAYLVRWYRLDGTVRLRHSRFLHLDLDLEFRVDTPDWGLPPPLPTLEQLSADGAPPEPSATVEAGTAPGGVSEAAAGTAEPEPEAFRIHRLQQSRQVRTGEMHYFDTAYLGVLARVTPLGGD